MNPSWSSIVRHGLTVQLHLHLLAGGEDRIDLCERIEKHLAVFAEIAAAGDEVSRRRVRVVFAGLLRPGDGNQVGVCFPAVNEVATVAGVPGVAPPIAGPKSSY